MEVMSEKRNYYYENNLEKRIKELEAENESLINLVVLASDVRDNTQNELNKYIGSEIDYETDIRNIRAENEKMKKLLNGIKKIIKAGNTICARERCPSTKKVSQILKQIEELEA